MARITPAYAGSSHLLSAPAAAGWDHPRIRGEQIVLRILMVMLLGSPPHTRGAGQS